MNRAQLTKSTRPPQRAASAPAGIPTAPYANMKAEVSSPICEDDRPNLLCNSVVTTAMRARVSVDNR